MTIPTITAYFLLAYCLVLVARGKWLAAMAAAVCGYLVAAAWRRLSSAIRTRS